MSRKILLTGAGFTHNFRLPLARHVWGMIFNDPCIQRTKNVRGELLKNQDYEKLYSLVIATGKFKDDRSVFLKRIDEVFNGIFESLSISAISNESGHGVSFSDLRRFINLFSGAKNNETPYVFTLNQDLFLERLYLLSGEMLFSPYVGNCLWNFSHHAKQEGLTKSHSQLITLEQKIWSNSGDGIVPTPEVLKQRKADFNIKMEALKRKYPLYIKVHGSIGWQYAENRKDTPVVMGTGKGAQIKAHCLLQEYFELFNQVLSEKNTSLLVIGYSFADKHINQAIADAIANYQLKLHIINPQPIDQFYSDLRIKALQLDHIIYHGIRGYYEGTLKDFFPYTQHNPIPEIIQSKSLLWEQLKANFFESE